MSSSCCIFDFADTSPICCLLESHSLSSVYEEYPCRIKLKFPIVLDGLETHITDIFKKTISGEKFTANIFDDNGKGKKITEVFFEKVSLTIKAEDTFDLEIIFSAKETNETVVLDQNLIKKAIALNGYNCVLFLVDDCGDCMNGNSTISLQVTAQKGVDEVFGTMSIINSFLNANNDLSPVNKIKRCKGNSFLNVGYKVNIKNDLINWMLNLYETKCDIKRRNIKDGIDLVEIDFKGKIK